MRFAMTFILIAGTTSLKAHAAPAGSGLEILSQLADANAYTGRVQNGAPLGACQTRITKNNDGSVLVEMAYAAGSKKLIAVVPARAEVVAASSSMLVYEEQDGSGVHVSHLNNSFFHVTVIQGGAGRSVTCGSFVNFLAQ